MVSNTPPVKDPISDDTPIWRYMDLPKFVWMLATRRLWFARAAKLHDDPYEGFCKAAHCEMPSDAHGPKWVLDEPGTTPSVSLERLRAEISHSSAEICENAREHLYVNSWSRGCESLAMWQIHSSVVCGTAVRSSIGQFQRAARFAVRSDQYAFGRVEYHSNLESSAEIQRDFSTGPIPVGSGLWPEVLKLGFHKRSCYKYENEWRAALYQDERPGIAGVEIDFDLEELISAVFVGAQAEDFFVVAVRAIMDKFLLRKLPLERSVLGSSGLRPGS